ncbi:MAG: hypothetical protein U9Q70_10410 [Chloroflexota bacterium]|nr:hypothetical protein [Chloroflexota bacterium]
MKLQIYYTGAGKLGQACELAGSLGNMVGFRNTLVHQYDDLIDFTNFVVKEFSH